MFSEKFVEEYGYTSLQDGDHNTELGNSLPGGKGGPEIEGDAYQEGGVSSVTAPLEVNAAYWCLWGENGV